MTKPQPYEKASILSKKDIMINNFLGGIFWALGATIGLALIFALLALIAKYINFIPIFGSFISQIINYVLATNHNLQH